MLLHVFWFEYQKNEFVPEDGTNVLPAEEHVIFIRNKNRFPLDLLFPFQAIMQNDCK